MGQYCFISLDVLHSHCVDLCVNASSNMCHLGLYTSSMVYRSLVVLCGLVAIKLLFGFVIVSEWGFHKDS